MKIGQTAKQIDSLIKHEGYKYQRNFGEYMGKCTTWDDNRCKWNTVNSTFVARKYSQIIDMIKECNARVKIEGKLLKIVYATGSATIGIDELVKTILIPELSQYIVND